MQNRSLIFIATLSLAITMTDISFAKEFQLKGVSIGMAENTACGAAPVTKKQDDIIKKYKASIPSLVEIGASECNVKFESFGGQRIAKPASLLFLNGKLILIKIELNKVAMGDFIEILNAFINDYGKQQRSISRPFVTDTWMQNGEVLTIEREGNEQWDNNGVIIILRDEKRFAEYKKLMNTNSNVFKKIKSIQTRNDM